MASKRLYSKSWDIKTTNKEGIFFYKVIETAVDVGAKKGKEMDSDVKICMVENEGSARFAILDGEKYGKNSVLDEDEESYSQGVVT